MWFLLSLNLSHWIGSFSTVGLDSHLGFRQKGLREANHFTFSFWREEERELRRGTNFEELSFSRLHNFRGEAQSWHASQGIRTVRFGRHRNWGKCWAHLPRRWTAFIIVRTLHRFWGHTAQRLRSVQSVPTVPFLHSFRGGYQACFPRKHYVLVGTEFKAVQQH